MFFSLARQLSSVHILTSTSTSPYIPPAIRSLTTARLPYHWQKPGTGSNRANSPPYTINMSLSNLANMCSHLNNVNKARLGLTSVPNTKLHRALCLAFQNSGLVSSVILGSKAPPRPHPIHGQPVVDGETETVRAEPVTQSNVASRRIWLGLKYWQSEPVLGKLSLVSRPKRRINLDVPQLRRVVRGMHTEHVSGLRSPGECLFLTTDKGIMEARECVEKKVGGLVLCRMQ